MNRSYRLQRIVFLLLLLAGFWKTAQVLAQNRGVTLRADTLKPDLIVQLGHTAGVSSIAYSPDGQMLASGSFDSTVVLWDVAGGRELRTFKGQSRIGAVTFSSDGKRLVAGSDEGLLQVWDVSQGRELKRFKGHAGKISAVVFSPDGSLLASAGDDKTIKLWSVSTLRARRVIVDDSEIYSIAFSKDNTKVLSGGGNGLLRIWSLATGHELQTLRGHSRFIHCIALDSTGKILATAGGDLTIKLWDLTSGRELHTLKGHLTSIRTIAFSPDGRKLASGSYDGKIKLWDVGTGKETLSLKGHSATVSSIAFSPRSNLLLASGSSDRTTKVWNISDQKDVVGLTGHSSQVESVALSLDGKKLVVAAGNELKLWDITTGRELRAMAGHADQVTAVAFSPDGKRIASASQDNSVKLWDVETGQNLLSFVGHEAEVTSVTFSYDGKMIASGSVDGTVKVWRPDAVQALRTFEGHISTVTSVAFSPDNKTLASGSFDRLVKLWSIDSGKELQTLMGHATAVMSVAISPDMKLLASASADNTVKLWELQTGQNISTLRGHTQWVKSIAFSPDSKILASGSLDHTIRLWEVDDGRQLRVLQGHSTSVVTVAFHPDGYHLLSGSEDCTVKLWNVKDGVELGSLISLDQNNWVVVTPDGHFDTNDLDEINGLHWIVPDEPFTPLAPEIFMRDYFQPKLLPRLLNNLPLRRVRSIGSLNRVQPEVRILDVRTEAGGVTASVTVEVTQASRILHRRHTSIIRSSGAYDLRLFRDNRLVAEWPTSRNLPLDKGVNTSSELLDWRIRNRINCDPLTGKFTHTFNNIRLPHHLGQVRFTGYAFNEDRVKSPTAQPYIYESIPSKSAAKGRAYLIAVGINANESGWNLEFAVKSAQDLRRLVADKLKSQYEVVDIQLLSDLETDSPRVAVDRATKANLQAVFDLLAGRSVNSSRRKDIDPSERIKSATPDDMVFFFISSHGYADGQGDFYLIPYDTGDFPGITEGTLNNCLKQFDRSQECNSARAFLERSISSSDLARWWKDVDAGEMVMILDSCHSAAAPGREFRPGPLGDRGFGQLSYDKGMRILAATQPDKTARATLLLGEGHSLLTDALISIWNSQPQLTLGQWLRETEKRVPARYEQLYPNMREVQFPVLLDFARQ